MTIIIRHLFIITLLTTPLYLARFELFNIPTNALDILLILTISVMILYCYRQRYFSKLRNIKNIKITALSLVLLGSILIVIGAIISTVIADNPPAAWGIIKSWLVLPLLFGVSVYTALVNQIITATKLVMTLIIGALIVAIIAIGYDISGITTYDHRLRSWYLSPNHLAMIIAPALAMSITMLISKLWHSSSSKFAQNQTLGILLSIITILALIYTLYRTQSIGGWIGVSCAITVTIILFWWRDKSQPKPTSKSTEGGLTTQQSLRRLWQMISIVAIFIVIIVAVISLPKITETLTNYDRSPLASRIMIWTSAVAIGSDNHITGIAPGQFQTHYLNYQQFYPPYLEWAVPQPHNLLLAFWLQTGIIGLLGFLILICTLLWQLVSTIFASRYVSQCKDKIRQVTALVLLAALITIGIHGIIDTPILKNDLALIFATLCALALFATRRP